MTLFYPGGDMDFSDSALLERAGAESGADALDSVPAPAEAAGDLADSPGLDQPGESLTLPVTPAATADPWQQAAGELDRLWPELAGRKRELFNKMGEISGRYGDPGLWRRQPQGIMREAALELLGPPRGLTERAVREAAKAARAAALAEAEARQRAKIGLAPGHAGRSAPPPLTEEQKLIRAMSTAKGRGIF